MQPTVKLLIGGEFVESKSSQWVDVLDPVREQALRYTAVRDQD